MKLKHVASSVKDKMVSATSSGHWADPCVGMNLIAPGPPAVTRYGRYGLPILLPVCTLQSSKKLLLISFPGFHSCSKFLTVTILYYCMRKKP